MSEPDAFDGTRDPLLATFKFRGKEFTVINNHLTSALRLDAGVRRPAAVRAGRRGRARSADRSPERSGRCAAGRPARGNPFRASKGGRVIVLGDLNTMQWTDDLTGILPGTGADRVLTNLIDRLTDDNVYTFNFEGNSQVLDSFFVTDNLLAVAEFDIVHVNVDFPRVDDTVGSDHEPLLARFDL